MTDPETQKKMDALMGVNMNEPIIKVNHAHLLRTGDESIYRSHCPVCELGALLVGREKIGGPISKIDRCILCAQQFEYVDLADIEKQDPESIEMWEKFKSGAVNYDELHVYCAIDELGAVIWRLGHSMNKGYIEGEDRYGVQKDINYMHKMSGFLFKLTTKFGVSRGEDLTPTESYRRWYAWWKAYFTNMTDDEWGKFERDLACNKTDGYRPEGDWRSEEDLKIEKAEFILGKV